MQPEALPAAWASHTAMGIFLPALMVMSPNGLSWLAVMYPAELVTASTQRHANTLGTASLPLVRTVALAQMGFQANSALCCHL